MSSNNFISLLCPTCGAPLRVSTSKSTFECEHCGVPHVLRASVDGAFIAEPIMRRIDDVQDDIGKLRYAVRIPELRCEIEGAYETIAELQAQQSTKQFEQHSFQKQRGGQIRKIITGVVFMIIAYYFVTNCSKFGFEIAEQFSSYNRTEEGFYRQYFLWEKIIRGAALVPGGIGILTLLVGINGLSRTNQRIQGIQAGLDDLGQKLREWKEYVSAKRAELRHCEDNK